MSSSVMFKYISYSSFDVTQSKNNTPLKLNKGTHVRCGISGLPYMLHFMPSCKDYVGLHVHVYNVSMSST